MWVFVWAVACGETGWPLVMVERAPLTSPAESGGRILTADPTAIRITRTSS